jgi:hypothetical protein
VTKVFSRWNVLGSLLFLIFVGEVTVASANGLFTPQGFMVLVALYFCYFLLFDSIVFKYNLRNLDIVLVNFALYSILITGLLNGELGDYLVRPHDRLITTLIRIQCSFYPLFAYYLLKKLATQRSTPLAVGRAALVFLVFVLIVTPSKSFGLIRVIQTAKIAPVIIFISCLLAVGALLLALRAKSKAQIYTDKLFGLWTLFFLILGLIPGLSFFLALLGAMIIVSVVYLLKPGFRNTSVV